MTSRTAVACSFDCAIPSWASVFLFEISMNEILQRFFFVFRLQKFVEIFSQRQWSDWVYLALIQLLTSHSVCGLVWMVHFVFLVRKVWIFIWKIDDVFSCVIRLKFYQWLLVGLITSSAHATTVFLKGPCCTLDGVFGNFIVNIFDFYLEESSLVFKNRRCLFSRHSLKLFLSVTSCRIWSIWRSFNQPLSRGSAV